MLYPHGYTENLFEYLMSMDLQRNSDLDVFDKNRADGDGNDCGKRR